MRRGIRIPDNEHFGSAALMLNGSNYHGSVYYIENYISPPPFFSAIIFFFFLHTVYLQECKNKHIFDHFVLGFEQIVFINFQFVSPSALSAIFPPPQGGGKM